MHRKEERLEVIASDRWADLEKVGAPDPLDGRLERAGVVLAPMWGYMGRDRPLFPSDTRELFRHLRDTPGHGMRIEVADSGAKYQELSLNSQEWFLPLIMIAELAQAPYVVALVSQYLYERLRSVLPGRNVAIESDVCVKSEHGEVTIRYRGPADAWERVMLETLASLPRGDSENQ